MSAPKPDPSGEPAAPARTPDKKPGGLRRVAVGLLLFVLVLGGAAWLLTPTVLDQGIRWALREFLPGAGFSLVEVEVEGGLGRPIVIRNLAVGPSPALPTGSVTDLRVARIEVAPIHFFELLRQPDRFLSRVSIQGVEGTLDLRAKFLPAGDEMAVAPDLPGPALLPFLPRRLDLQTEKLTVLLDEAKVQLAPCEITLAEGRTRSWSTGPIAITAGDAVFQLPSTQGLTAWKDGILYLAELAVLPELAVRSLRLNLVRPGGFALDLEAEGWGGWLRSDITVGAPGNPAFLGLTLWAGRLQVPQLLRTAGRDEEISGTIHSMRLSFRGQLDHLLDADATMRLEAGEMAWENRAWEELNLGLQLHQKRIALSEFLLRQKDNRVSASGEVLWPEDGQWLQTSARLEANVEVREIGELLSLLLPTPPAEGSTGGGLQVKASVEAKGGQVDGEISAAAEDLRWQNTALGSFTTTAKFDGQQIRLQEFSWQNGADSIRSSGSVRLQEPNVYEGEVRAELRQLTPYLSLFWREEWGDIPTGGFSFFWQGDGTRLAHSGGLELHLLDLKQPSIPEGITGVMAGTYSPENFYFGRCELRHDPFLLTWRLSAGQGGLYFDQINLQARSRSLLSGEFYLPWNPWPLLLGEEWTAGLLPQKNLYVDLRSSKLQLQDLAGLVGQKLPVRGQLHLASSASGTLAAPVVTTRLELENLQTEGDRDRTVLVDRGRVDFHAEDGLAKVEGTIRVPRLDPILLALEFPFGLSVQGEEMVWIDPRGTLAGKISLPRTELRQFQALVPEASRLAGVVSGEIELGQSLDNPSINGRISLQNGQFEMDRNVPPLSDLALTVRFDGDSFELENAGGKVGGGPFQLQGSGRFSDWENPAVDLRLSGQQLLVMRDRQLRLRSNLDLQVSGSLQGGGSVAGSIALTDGRVYQRLEITPLLQAAQAESGRAPLLVPDLTGLVPPPFAAWTLDVQVSTADPFLIVGNVASGTIEPDLRIVGTLGDPRPTGLLTLRDLRAFLPFSVVHIPEGRVVFTEENPRSPSLDIRGYSEVLEYEIMLLAQGPLEDQNIILRSDPPLSEDQILLLLTTGLTPGSGAGLGEAAAGQGSLLLLRTLAQQFEPEGIDLDSLINRIQVGSQPPPFSGMRPTLMGEFRLTDDISLFSRRDGFGYFSGGAVHTWRFR